MTQPPIPPPLPRSQTGSWLSFHAGQHDPRRIAAEEAHRAELIRRANRRVNTVRLVEQLPRTAPIPAPPVRSQPPTFTPEVGGCVECGHVQRAHERGKDTPIPCTARDCGCLGFVDGRAMPWSAIAWGVFAAVLAVVAIALLVIGEGGNAFVVGSVAAVSGLLSWIYSAPNQHGGR